jgi:hypothetical protein
MVKIRHDQQNLPMFQYRDQVIEAVRKYQVIVVAGDTGCGKSTQVDPTLCILLSLYFHCFYPGSAIFATSWLHQHSLYTATAHCLYFTCKKSFIWNFKWVWVWSCISGVIWKTWNGVKLHVPQLIFQVRFEKSRTKASRIIFLTEGLIHSWNLIFPDNLFFLPWFL